MPTLGVVIITQGSNGAPSKCKITEVAVTNATGLRAQVEGTGGPYTVEERPLEMRIPLVEFPHMDRVVAEEIGRPVGKDTCSFVRRGTLRGTVGGTGHTCGKTRQPDKGNVAH